jgi:peptidyl-prolyl cis-trans isomerase A (cyclophilin A)
MMRKWFRVFGIGTFAAALNLLCPAQAQTDVGAAPANQVLIQTSLGDITVQLDRAHAPITVENFLRYVKEGHYDGTIFYRVVPGFVIQGGSYESATKARPVHKPIALEANNGLHNLRGSIAMAREDDPNTATAEFFIDLADDPGLDQNAGDTANATGYAVFGQVIAGQDVVDRIAAMPLGDNGPVKGAAPVEPVVVRQVSVVPAVPAGH